MIMLIWLSLHPHLLMLTEGDAYILGMPLGVSFLVIEVLLIVGVHFRSLQYQVEPLLRSLRQSIISLLQPTRIFLSSPCSFHLSGTFCGQRAHKKYQYEILPDCDKPNIQMRRSEERDWTLFTNRSQRSPHFLHIDICIKCPVS